MKTLPHFFVLISWSVLNLWGCKTSDKKSHTTAEASGSADYQLIQCSGNLQDSASGDRKALSGFYNISVSAGRGLVSWKSTNGDDFSQDVDCVDDTKQGSLRCSPSADVESSDAIRALPIWDFVVTPDAAGGSIQVSGRWSPEPPSLPYRTIGTLSGCSIEAAEQKTQLDLVTSPGRGKDDCLARPAYSYFACGETSKIQFLGCASRAGGEGSLTKSGLTTQLSCRLTGDGLRLECSSSGSGQSYAVRELADSTGTKVEIFYISSGGFSQNLGQLRCTDH